MDENLDNDNNISKNNFFQLLMHLNEYDEMRNISNYIFLEIDNDNFISPKIIQNLNSVLNCSFIKNLREFCWNEENNIISFQIINEVFKYFNNLINRKIGIKEIEYIISNYSSKYNPNFKISFPQFKAMDLIYLFIDFNNDSKIINSFLIKNVNLGQTCLKRLVHIEIDSQNDEFIEDLDMIVKIIFEELKKGNNANKLS